MSRLRWDLEGIGKDSEGLGRTRGDLGIRRRDLEGSTFQGETCRLIFHLVTCTQMGFALNGDLMIGKHGVCMSACALFAL